jgi:hypothetical protein
MKLFQENTKLKFWHLIWTLGSVKVTRGYVYLKKIEGCFNPPHSFLSLTLFNQHLTSHCAAPEKSSHPDSGQSRLRLCHF